MLEWELTHNQAKRRSCKGTVTTDNNDNNSDINNDNNTPPVN